ncbi:MAG: phytanoyl-CoA dioxygenase family protein [Novosphingobium sp.]
MTLQDNDATEARVQAHFHLSDTELRFFEENGYVGPFDCISPEQGEQYAQLIAREIRNLPLLDFQPWQTGGRLSRLLRRITRKLSRTAQTAIIVSRKVMGHTGPTGRGQFWYKSAHFLIPEIGHIGAMRQIVDPMQSILGPDLLLWGAQIVQKQHVSHRWHSDVEHVAWHGATAWLGVHNVSRENTMKVFAGSHLFPDTAQELAKRTGANLEDDESILAALRLTVSDARIDSIDIKPGQFFIFAGKTWHASYDVSGKLRTALIFQYCAPSQRVRIPRNFDPANIDFDPVQPWVMQVSGEDRHRINHVR